jgi:WXG100 family type VII secretion target
MTRIRLNTQQAREVAQRLCAEADALDRVTNSLTHAIGSLDTWAWDGRSRARAESHLNRVAPSGRDAAQMLEDLGRKLRHVADTFEREDATASRNLEGMSWVEWEIAAAISLEIPKTPSAASLETVLDRRSPFQRFLGGIPGLNFFFPPPAGGEPSVDEQLQLLFGRDVSAVDGDKNWTEKEIILMRGVLNDFPQGLADRSVLSNIYRDSGEGRRYAGVFCPKEAEECPDPRSIVMNDSAYSYGLQKRYGVDADTAFQAVLLHEMVHASQSDSLGMPNKLVRDFALEMGWEEIPGVGWNYTGDFADLPGADEGQFMYPDLENTNPMEDMAESITFYRYAPERLSPERYNFVKNQIFDGKEFK